MAGSHECETENLDPGVPVRRRIAFRSTNLIGPFQDDAKIFSEKEKAGLSELGMTPFGLLRRLGALHVGD